ncbi:MAG: DNA-binding protein [Colwellia sp.]|jgi:Plasmid replication region DNA-binding N-term.
MKDTSTPESPLHLQIMEACDLISLKGDSPSAQKVLNYIGKGSMRDIQAGITEWRTLLHSRMSYYSQYPDIPQEVVDVASKLMKVANIHANEALLEERHIMDSEVNELRESRANALADEKRSLLELKTAQSQVTTSEEIISSLGGQLDQKNEAIHSKNEDLIAIKGELSKSNAIIAEVRSNLRTTLAENSTIRQQFKVDIENINSELKSAQSEHLVTKGQLDLSISESKKLLVDNDRLHSEKEKLELLHTEISNHKTIIAEMNIQLNELNMKSTQLQLRVNHQEGAFEMQLRIKDLELDKASVQIEALKDKLHLELNRAHKD